MPKLDAESILMSLKAHLGNPDDYEKRAKEAKNHKKAYMFLGMGKAYGKVLEFINSLEATVEAYQEREEAKKQEAKQLQVEDSIKGPTGKHARNQTSFPSSFSASKTFGGVDSPSGPQSKKKGKEKAKKGLFEQKLDAVVFEGIESVPEIQGRNSDTTLDAHDGSIIVNGEAVIDKNHAQVLSDLVKYLQTNNPEVLSTAIDRIGEYY